jgi:hypothetical protein
MWKLKIFQNIKGIILNIYSLMYLMREAKIFNYSRLKVLVKIKFIFKKILKMTIRDKILRVINLQFRPYN